MIKTNFKHALMLAVGVAGLALGSTTVASANANDGGNQQYSATQTAENSQTVKTMETTDTTGNAAVVSEALTLAKNTLLMFGVVNLKGEWIAQV